MWSPCIIYCQKDAICNWLFHGIANWEIYLDHIPNNLMNLVTGGNFGSAMRPRPRVLRDCHGSRYRPVGRGSGTERTATHLNASFWPATISLRESFDATASRNLR